MELRQLRTFEMVARHGSFTAVARELSVTQPAVSAQIQALESELGVRLLERLPRQVLLTSMGEALLGYARRMLNLEAEAKRVLAELTGAQDVFLRIGASPTIGAYVLPEIVGEFKRSHPDVRIVAEIESTYRVAEALQTHAIDVGLVEAVVDADTIVAHAFRTDELVLIAPPTHPWARRPSIQPLELAEQPLIAREPASGSRALVEEALRALGVGVLPTLELGGVEAIKNAVKLGLGVSFISRHAIRVEEKLGSLMVVPVEGLELRRFFYCIHDRPRYPSPVLQAFLDLVQGIGGEVGQQTEISEDRPRV
jgi:DNA-binding transcriptional LysR family regulator